MGGSLRDGTDGLELLALRVALARGGEVTPWGKCDPEPIRFVLPLEVKAELQHRAAAQGMTVSEFCRVMVFVALYGRDEVKRRYAELLESIAE